MKNTFNYNKVIEESVTCPICYKLAENAVESRCCGFIFCQKCINLLDKNECPCCREPKAEFVSSLSMRKLIKNFPVNCKYNCGFEDSYENIDKHYYMCKYRDYYCDVNKCLFVGKKDDFMQHILLDHNKMMVNICENFSKIFNPKFQKMLEETTFKNDLKKNKDMIVFHCSDGNRINNNNKQIPCVFYDEVVDIDDSD